MKKTLFIFFVIVGFMANAQPPKKFYCTYGGNGYDVGYDVKQTLDNGYIITGLTSSFGQGNTDLYLLKLDSMGQKKFETSFGGYSNEIGKSVVQLSDSSYVMAGYTSSTGVGGYDVFLVKADKNGSLLWQKTIGGSDWDFAYSMDTTTDGGFIIAGTTYSFGHGNADGYIIKTDGNGNVIWTKTYGGKEDDEFKSVIQTADGNYALAGYTKSYNDSLGDGWIFRVGVIGDSIYSKSVGGAYSDILNNVIEMPNTNLYYVGANKSQTSGANTVSWRHVIDVANNVVINDFIGSTNTERYNSSATGINATIVTVGYNNFLGNNSDANIHVFTPNFGYISYNPFGVDNTDELFSVSPTKDKGFVSIGSCIGNISLLSDILFVKTDSLGHNGISIVGIKENSKSTQEYSIFPNPTSHYINIKIPNYKNYKKLYYKIVDFNGSIVLSNTINESLEILEISTLSNGLYLLKVFDGNNLLVNSKISVIK